MARQSAKAQVSPEPPSDYPYFHYDPDFIADCYGIWASSDYKALPSAGGFLDQDSNLMHDLFMFQRHFAHEERKEKERLQAQQKP